jgi:CubicO group peptidase (beta-lactamase class C family)
MAKVIMRLLRLNLSKIKWAFSLVLFFTPLLLWATSVKKILLPAAARTLATQDALNTQWHTQYPELYEYLFKNNEGAGDNSKKTDGFIMLKNGQIIAEEYARGYDSHKKHIQWSISKTVMSILFGVAHEAGLYQLNDSICKYIEVPRKNEQCEITVKSVLQWSTGIQWLEDYEKTNTPRKASVLAMLYGEGRQNMAQFVLNQPILAKPGTRWLYSSGDSILGALLLQKIYDKKSEDSFGPNTHLQPLRQISKTQLFDKIGMKYSIWEEDLAGTIGSAYYLYSTPRDLVQVGQLILQNGVWDKKQLISKEYMKFMLTVPEAFKNNRPAHSGKSISGAHIWLNDPQGANHAVPWKAPLDTIVAQGHWGQYLVVLPTEKVIAVRTGDNREPIVNVIGFVEQVAKAAGYVGGQ